MDAYNRLLVQVIWVGVILSAMATSAVAAAYELALPNCTDRCGDVEIPFPFGIADGCYLNQNDDFFINCTAKSSGWQQPLTGNLVVQNISVQGQLDIFMFVASICHNESGMVLPEDSLDSSLTIPSSTFTISSTQNVFMAIGCDTYAFLDGVQNNGNFSIGCATVCTNQSNILNGTCSGMGCCEVEIPERVSNFTSAVYSISNHTQVWSFNPCGFAFVVKKDQFSFSSVYVSSPQFNKTLPMVVDWTIPDKRCENPENKSDYICGGNSTCYSPTNGYAYRCKCDEGYEGNPYLPTGCKVGIKALISVQSKRYRSLIMEEILSSLLNITKTMEQVQKRFLSFERHFKDFRDTHNEMQNLFQESLNETKKMEEQIDEMQLECSKQDDDYTKIQKQKPLLHGFPSFSFLSGSAQIGQSRLECDSEAPICNDSPFQHLSFSLITLISSSESALTTIRNSRPLPEPPPSLFSTRASHHGQNTRKTKLFSKITTESIPSLSSTPSEQVSSANFVSLFTVNGEKVVIRLKFDPSGNLAHKIHLAIARNSAHSSFRIPWCSHSIDYRPKRSSGCPGNSS